MGGWLVGSGRRRLILLDEADFVTVAETAAAASGETAGQGIHDITCRSPLHVEPGSLGERKCLLRCWDVELVVYVWLWIVMHSRNVLLICFILWPFTSNKFININCDLYFFIILSPHFIPHPSITTTAPSPQEGTWCLFWRFKRILLRLLTSSPIKTDKMLGGDRI